MLMSRKLSQNKNQKNNNRHIAATGRFATIEEIIQNFYFNPVNEISYSNSKSDINTNRNINNNTNNNENINAGIDINNYANNTNINNTNTNYTDVSNKLISFKNFSSKHILFKHILFYAFFVIALIFLLMPFQRINSINLSFFIFKDFVVVLIIILFASFFLLYKRHHYKSKKYKYNFTHKNFYDYKSINNINNNNGDNNKYRYMLQCAKNLNNYCYNNNNNYDGSNNNNRKTHKNDKNYFKLGILNFDNYRCEGNSYINLNNINDNINTNSIDDLYNMNNINNNHGKNFDNKLIIGIDRKKRFEHIMIISPTGGGKTLKYIIPSIKNDACFNNTSVYAIDIDGPYLYNAVKDNWLINKKRIIHFDPYNADSIHFNPLIERYNNYNNNETKIDKNFNKNTYYNNDAAANIKIMPVSDDKLYELSSMIFYADNNELKGGDIQAHKYYSKRSADILYGCLLYMKYKYDIKYLNLITAKKFFEKGFNFIEKEIKSFNGENSKKIKEIFNNFFEIPSYERAKIITDILNGLDFIKNGTVEDSFKTNEDVLNGGNFFTIKDLFDCNKDTLIIVAVPKEKISSGGSRLISFITDLVIKEIYEYRRTILVSLLL